MKKQVEFSVRMDTTEFDRSIENIQRKLKDAYATPDMIRMQQVTSQRLGGIGMGGMMASPGLEAFQKSAQQSRREMDQLIRDQVVGQERLAKALSERLETLSKMKTKQSELVKGTAEELAIKEKIARVEENNNRIKETYKQRDAILNQSIDARERLTPQGMDRFRQAYREGGIGGAATAAGRMFMQNPLTIGGRMAASAGSALLSGAEMYRAYSGMPLGAESAMGSAVGNTAGRDIGDIYSGRAPFEMVFASKKAQAARMALAYGESTRASDVGSLAGSAALIGGGAAMAFKGGSVGAGFGSAVPGLGTAAGAAAGAAPGLTLAGTGMYNIARNPRLAALALSPLSSTARNYYESGIAQQIGEKYSGAYDALKQQTPSETAAVDQYQQNFMRNLQAQRSMGMGSKAFYGAGGFMSGGGEFTPEMMLQMSQGILGAGGSSRAAGGNSLFANQLARKGLTNADAVLGTLSGGLGTSEVTRSATIDILAEGMKLGLDKSEYAEENRRFTQMTAEIISRSGATSGFGETAGGFGRFVAENTNKGLEAAKGAYEQYQQRSGETSGPRGVMKAAAFMKDEVLSKLSSAEQQALLSIPEEEANTGNLKIQGAASSLGVSPGVIISSMKGAYRKSESRFKESDDARDRLKKRGIDIASVDPEKYSQLPKDVQEDIWTITKNQSLEFGNMGVRGTKSTAAGFVGGPEKYGPSVGREAVEAGLVSATGRPEDETVKALSKVSGIVLENFNNMTPALESAAKQTALWTKAVLDSSVALAAALEASKTGKTSNLSALINNLNIATSAAQKNGGKPTQ